MQDNLPGQAIRIQLLYKAFDLALTNCLNHFSDKSIKSNFVGAEYNDELNEKLKNAQNELKNELWVCYIVFILLINYCIFILIYKLM